jgi:hypothetical protein
MATFSQLPGTLNLAFVRGDEFGTTLDFDVNLTGYTVAAELLSINSLAKVLDITTTVTSEANGQVGISMTEAETGSLAAGTYRWVFYWDAPGSVRRTVLSGFVEVAR